MILLVSKFIFMCVFNQCFISTVSVSLMQVFDYDFGLQDDFMGSAYLYLESLEQHRSGNSP